MRIENRIRKNGARAYHEGYPLLGNNPYNEQTKAFRLWAEGWKKAQSRSLFWRRPLSQRPTVCWLFKLVWWRWFRDYRVVRVKGWRTALVDYRYGHRETITACPWGLD